MPPRRRGATSRPSGRSLLDAGAPDTPAALAALAADPTVVVVDELGEQLEQLVQGRAPRERLSGARLRDAVERVLDGREPARFGTWVFYPWSRRLVHVLPEPLHRELRLDRNRYAITTDEQERLAGLCVAVAGLSVGRAVVSTMAHEGIGGELRLADFDVLDLSNLNRVAGGARRRRREQGRAGRARGRRARPVHPRRRLSRTASRRRTIADFVAGADVIVDECDDLEMKVRLREHARAAGRPGGHGHEPSRDARRRALRPRARVGRPSMGCSATSPRPRSAG